MVVVLLLFLNLWITRLFEFSLKYKPYAYYVLQCEGFHEYFIRMIYVWN